MEIKLTPKQEQFCQSYIETGNASEAYRRAYNAENMKPETINVKASELLSNGKVSVRVDELQLKHRKRHNVTVDTITDELDAGFKLAMKNENPSAAVSASLAKAKLHGLMIEKRQIETVCRTRDDKNKFTDEELEEMIAKRKEREQASEEHHTTH